MSLVDYPLFSWVVVIHSLHVSSFREAYHQEIILPVQSASGIVCNLCCSPPVLLRVKKKKNTVVSLILVVSLVMSVDKTMQVMRNQLQSDSTSAEWSVLRVRARIKLVELVTERGIENRKVLSLFKFYINGSINRKSNLITAQQDATYSVYYISVGSSTCFGCWHPSSGARTTDSCVSYDTHGSVTTQQREWMVVDPVNQYQKL